MFTFDLLYPWIALALTLVPLLYVQRWLHRHLFGVGFLVGKEKQTATLFYYALLLPGVVLHELSHYMMAGVFNVRSTRFAIYPEAQEDGSLEMGFVQLEQVKNPVFAAFIGIAPLLTGMLAVVWISNSILDLPGFLAKLQTGDIYVIGDAISKLLGKPDFVVWAYLLFGVANAMMPNKEDRQGWWIVGAALGALLLFMTVIGLQKIVVNWLSGGIARALYSLSTVFGLVLFLDAVAAALVWIIESVLERITGQRVEYQPHTAQIAAPTRSKLTSVYQLNLPLPPLPGKVVAPAAPRLTAGGERPALGSGTPGTARPALPSTSGQPATASPRPALTGGSGSTDADRPKFPTSPPMPSPGSRPSIPAPASAGSKPSSPATPGPAQPASTPAGASGQARSPFGSPAPQSPAAQSPGGQPPARPSPAPSGGPPPRPGGSTPPAAQPNKPFGASPTSSGAGPSKPANPISGPPALSRPGGPPPVPGRPTSPVPATPAPKSPFGAPPRAAKPSGGGDDDYIDADVIDEEDDGIGEPDFMKRMGQPMGGAKKSSNPFGADDDEEEDDGEPKYVGLDEV